MSQTIDACESERAEITVTTKETAPPTVISLISACVGSTMETLSATGVDLQWYSDNTTQTPLASAPTPDASNSGTISYFVSQTIDACESERAEIEVNILPPPATPTPTSNSPICVGSDLELSTTEVLGATYIWEGPDNFTSHSQNPHISNAQIEHAGMYKLRIQIGDCISDYGTITVDIHPIPTITFAEVSPICVDANPITLSASGTPNGGSGVFSGEEINDNSFNPTTAGVGEHIITYNYTASGCSASKTITIEVQDKPDVDFSLQATACANDEIIALTGTPTAGTFTASPSLNITSGFNPSLANLNQEYTITYEYSDGVCTNTAHKNITVYSPQPPIGTNASEVYTRITDQTSVPTLSANGTNVVWYSDAALTNQVGTGTTFQANAAEVIVNNEGIPGTYTYYAVSTEEGCVSTATQVTLTITDCSVVAPTPIVSLVEMCFGDSNPTSKTLEVTADAGNAIIWYFEGNEVQNNTTTTFIPSQTEVQTYSFEVSQFDATENCESPRATITLRINALPNVSFTPPADVCEGSKVINFDEYKSQTSGIVTCLEESSTCNEFNPQAQGTYTFEYSYTNPTTLCTNKIETQILVRELPTLNFAVIPNMCEYDNPLALTDLATPVGGTFSGDGVSANNFTPSLVTAGSTITIIYSYTDAHTCTNTATSEVQVFEKPHVTFNDITSTCIDETVDLLDFVNPKNGTFSGDGVVGTDFTMALDGTYEITYEITENGCSHSITKPIIVNPTPTVTVDAPSIICKNGSIVIPTKSPEGVNVVFNGNPITEIDPGLYVAGTYPLTFNYVDPVTLCSTEKLHYEPLWVEIREIPTPIVHDMTATIGDAPVSITATGSGGTFEWTNHIGEFIGTGETIVHNDISQTGLWHYCVKEFDGTCYSDEACMTLSVNDCNIPPPSIANATQSICVGESIPTFTANEIGTVTWYDNMHMPIHVGNDFTPSINADETGTFTYFATLINGCEGIPATISLTIHELPSLTLSVDEVLCNNTGIIQPVVTPTGGVFTLGSTEINNIDTDNLNSGLYTITYEYTNPTTNCSNTISKDIEIRQIPAPTVANKTSLLDPVDVTISAIGQGGTLTWKDQNDFIVTTGETMQHNGAVQIGSWNYCVYESDGICESEEACMTYTIIDCPTPAPNIEKPHISICKGEAIPTFIALETDKVTWYENGTQISTDSHFTPSISLDKTGTFEYYATLTSSGENACEGGGTTVLLTIHKLPTISISIDAVICKNSGTEIFPTHAEGIFTIETFINNVATDNLNTHTYPSGIHNFSSTTTNTVTGCSYTTSQSFELREITPPAVVDKTILITDTDYTISAISSGGTLTWTDYNNADMGSGTSINHIGPYEVGTWEYCVTETDGTCVSEAACMLFSIIDCPLLAPTVPNPLTQACINEPVTLSVVGTETIRWYAAHDLNTIVHTGTSYTFTPTTTGTQDFYVAQYDDNCEGARAKISVHVNETQKPIISGDLEICIDEETTLSAQITTGTVQWYTEDPSTALSVSSENSYTFEGVSEGTYTIWTTHSTTCTSEATETILTVKPKSTPPSISGSNACKGESITFTATGSNITWYSVGSSVAIASGNQYTVENTTNTDYTFEATQNTNGCVSEKASYTITVFDLPNKPIPQDTAICYGLPSGLLRVSSEYSHTNFMWYADTTLASIGNAKTLLPPNDNKSHSYFVRQTVDMCTSYATQVNLVRIEQPQPPVIQQQGVVGPSCDGKPMPRLNASGQNITWYDGNDAIIGHDNPFQANDEGVKTYTVYATQTVNSCESNKSSYTFTRLARPNAPTLNTSKTDIVSCEHDRAILYATSGSAQIRWVTDYNTNPEVIFGNQFPQTDYTPEFRKIEIRLYADNSICQSEDIFLTYELKPAPEIPQVSPDVICIGRDEMIATGNSTHMVWIDTVSKDVLSTDSYLNLE
ncbi:MAG: hypothetical protein M0R02_10555, partial [Bacteroidales bacterium]|nr:hypothetical protein [Bacteroidales bacterium]